MPREITFLFAGVCAAIGLYTAYRRGKLRRTLFLTLLLLLVPTIVIYFRQ